MSEISATIRDYFIETSQDRGRTWQAVNGEVYGNYHVYGVVPARYPAGTAEDQARIALGRLRNEPASASALYRLNSR